ncbi:MAG: hypothetical protein PGN37_20365 [Mycobacterium kyogaense]|uniref:hypothetical protein n=1 Tax=Mycobacterium kyogaense TaxID=2212479 RepID=UPI002FF788AD
MTAVAPGFRSVCALTGERAEGPSAFFRALDVLNARDEKICAAADDAADRDDWVVDEWWADR